jgi:hypothetical protein
MEPALTEKPIETDQALVNLENLEKFQTFVNTQKKRGRKPIYESDEERHAAKLRQTKESNKRMQEKRKEFETQMTPLQHELIKTLKNNIINTNVLALIDFVIRHFN